MTTYEVPMVANLAPTGTNEPEQIIVWPFDASAFEVLDTKMLDQYDSNETVLKSIGGDYSYPTLLRIGVYNKPVSASLPRGSTNVSIKMTWWVIVKDADGNETDAYQRSFVSADSGPLNRGLRDQSVVAAANIYSLLVGRDSTPVLHSAARASNPVTSRLLAGVSNPGLDDIAAVVQTV